MNYGTKFPISKAKCLNRGRHRANSNSMKIFQANQMPILANPMSISAQSEDICLDNLGTSPPYGMVPSLIEGRNSSHPVTIQCHSLSQPRINLIRSLSIQANPVPIRCQSDASPRSNFRSNINSPISKNGQSESILADPMPILCHY